MDTPPTLRPLGGRTPGGADFAVAVNESLPPLPPPGDVVVGVVDTGMVVEASLANPWFGDHVTILTEIVDPLGVLVHIPDKVVPAGDDLVEGFLAPADGHGTFVSGLILAEAPTARVAMYGVLDQRVPGSTLTQTDDELVCAAVEGLHGHEGLQVVNLSFGGGVYAGRLSDRLERAIAALIDAGVAVVAAAGNDAVDADVYPAKYDGVIGVGALDEFRFRPVDATPPLATFSNFGANVDAYAEGVQVLSAFVTYSEPGDEYPNKPVDLQWAEGQHPGQDFHGWARWSGTSFAAAIVSGRIAQYVVEHGGSGLDAWTALLQDAPIVNGSGRWIRRQS
jgi:subtilisin family serine protease